MLNPKNSLRFFSKKSSKKFYFFLLEIFEKPRFFLALFFIVASFSSFAEENLSRDLTKNLPVNSSATKKLSQSSKPQIQLANLYREDVDVQNYLTSEKLDGVRAYWDGKKLISRDGNVFKAPKWFIADFPNEHLEGELWIGRGKFEELSAIVRKENPIDAEWQKVQLMLFDMPKHNGIFSQRLEEMKSLVKKSNSKYLQIIEQSKISSHEELLKKLDEVVKNGGEGLMLHRADSLYQALRNDDLLKLKTFEDAEAIVISHISGTGKFTGMMGALLVENKEKIRFKIGTGFSDQQRKLPPKIGSLITYKFFGKTKNNKPRFASFIRIRDEI